MRGEKGIPAPKSSSQDVRIFPGKAFGVAVENVPELWNQGNMGSHLGSVTGSRAD